VYLDVYVTFVIGDLSLKSFIIKLKSLISIDTVRLLFNSIIICPQTIRRQSKEILAKKIFEFHVDGMTMFHWRHLSLIMRDIRRFFVKNWFSCQ
jgi:hypothetical protein